MLGFIVFILLLLTRAVGFLKLLRRTRWILLSLLLIYCFATPGIYLLPDLGWLSPTLQGLHAGGMQLARLLLLLAALAVLLQTTPRETLLSGIYTLLKPLRPFGVNAERFAVRVWLTMRYAEEAAVQSATSWNERLRQAFEPSQEASETLRLAVTPFSWRDWLVLSLALLLAAMVL